MEIRRGQSANAAARAKQALAVELKSTEGATQLAGGYFRLRELHKPGTARLKNRPERKIDILDDR